MSPADKYTTTWWCYSLTATDDEARAAFLRKWGYPPETVRRDHNHIWCGPVRIQEESTVVEAPAPISVPAVEVGQ